jgi:FkbM family methyltransferase
VGIEKLLLNHCPEGYLGKLAVALKGTKSQLAQDLLALSFSNFSESGYFVEIGACDGVAYSNTHLLEKNFHWRGLLAEPGKVWHKNLINNRSCSIDTRAVASISKKMVMFTETTDPTLSTYEHLTDLDHMSKYRFSEKSYEVATVSLNDLLSTHNAPSNINFLSIDTEGSELDILSTFDFKKYSVDFISVEHNFTINQIHIVNLLKSNGYVQVLKKYSIFDAWFVPERLSNVFID